MVVKNIVGKCPECGGKVIEFPKFYGCANWRRIDGECKFTIPKYFTGREVPSFVATELLKNFKSRLLQGFVSKQGNKFSACLMLIKGKDGRWGLKMEFVD